MRNKLFWLTLALLLTLAGDLKAAPPEARAKFYDFSEQLIDGEIRRPTALYTDARQRVKFDRLLKLKKSFLPDLFKTAREPVFR